MASSLAPVVSLKNALRCICWLLQAGSSYPLWRFLIVLFFWAPIPVLGGDFWTTLHLELQRRLWSFSEVLPPALAPNDDKPSLWVTYCAQDTCRCLAQFLLNHRKIHCPPFCFNSVTMQNLPNVLFSSVMAYVDRLQTLYLSKEERAAGCYGKSFRQ